MINNINIEKFLAENWQQKPFIIRGAFPEYQSPITAEELAGLSCENDVESRIVSEHHASPKWRLEYGPFKESRFSQLPETHWTLLVQGINKLLPDFEDLLRQFDFIPSWRIDDVMASYAVVDGSVGPHIDQYDVFLLQASGQRKWMISEQLFTEEELEADLPLKIIKDFKSESEWVLDPGDMLYLPPNVAHYGVALDNCITFSIGFRAPSHAELLTSYIDDYVFDLKDELRFQDPPLSTEQNNGEITTAAINQVQELLLSHFSDKAKIEDWFGRFITEYLNECEILQENSLSVADFLLQFEQNNIIRRSAAVRANYLHNQQGELSLYINGMRHNLKPGNDELAMLFCNQHINTYNDIKPYFDNNETAVFLCELYNSGYLEFDI